MAITLAADIVSDVIDAADPTAYRAALDKLTRLRSAAEAGAAEAAADPAATELFADQAADVARTKGSAAAGPARPKGVGAHVGSSFSSSIQGNGAAAVYRKFEGFVLQVLIETMLPKDETAFGKGTAGTVWRSMLAEQLGTQVAATGGIGIAKLLAAHPPHGGQPPQAAPPALPAPNPHPAESGDATTGRQDDGTGSAG